MYSRTILPVPKYPFDEGKPLFGSYSGCFESFDIRGMKRVFGNYPIPIILTNLRIFETISFVFSDDNFFGEIVLFNAHYFSSMDATFWNKKTKQRISYKKINSPSIIKFPQSLSNSSTACRNNKRYVRIQTKLQKKIVNADFEFVGSYDRPPCEGHLEMDLNALDSVDLSSLIPYKVKRKAMISYQLTAPLKGWITTGFDDHQLNLSSSIGFLDARKFYASLRTKGSFLLGLGKINGQTVSFRFGSSVYTDDNTYNDNVLFWGGKAWPLPAIKITRPYGIHEPWIIQDTESMIDLQFLPLSSHEKKISAFVIKADKYVGYGFFDGFLQLAENVKIQLKEFPGIAKKNMLRL